APTVLFREKDLPADERRALGERVAEVCAAAGAQLTVASDPTLARTLGAGTVHLAGDDPWPAEDDLAVGRSCHSAGQLADADTHGAAYATVSPIFATTSKPGYGPPLGLVGLRALVAGTRVPIVALGGVGPDDVGVCLAAGATGVAVMGAVMTAADPGAVVRELLDQEPVR
ncbi:MAG: thiamine phosphate synthase, partial [Acidimicrobiales bacterium]